MLKQTRRQWANPKQRISEACITVGLALAVTPLWAGASARAASGPCAVAVEKAERELFSWPRCFMKGGLRQVAMIRVRAAARAAVDGDDGLCWEQLNLSGYELGCTSSSQPAAPSAAGQQDAPCAVC